MKTKISAFILSIIMCVSIMPAISLAANRTYDYEEGMAQDLKELGLFKGVSDTDFALGRKPTRVEALTMLIRLLGKEKTAVQGSWKHPFNDVPAWADSYVGYAYQNGITNGVSDTSFGTGDANSQMYLTFVLRALGYTDKNGEDFLWNNPYTLAKTAGILYDCVNTTDFLRADVVLVSYAALSANIKGTTQSLAQKLIKDKVFTYDDYLKYYKPEALDNYKTSPVEYTAEQIYHNCSPAVFYVEVYDKWGDAFASGSGFFINDTGTAVTNYHVIEDAVSAKITLSDTQQVYDVVGVYDFNKQEDWAVIRVAITKSAYLEIGDASSITGGSTVFAIGSPLGLQNTITQGIVSNSNRVVDGINFIQTSAALSSGSSGGALINKYGQVIGITSAKFSQGENLGLALPMSIIEGYNKTNIISLSTLFGEDYVDPAPQNPSASSGKSDAFKALEAFVYKNANDEINGKKTYCEVEETKTGYKDFGIILEEDGALGIYMYEVYEDDEYYTQIDIEPSSDKSFTGYFYNVGKPYTCEGALMLDKKSFTQNTIISFETFEGDADRELNEEICSINIMECLDFVDYVYAEYLYTEGSFSVYDLGFKSY